MQVFFAIVTLALVGFVTIDKCVVITQFEYPSLKKKRKNTLSKYQLTVFFHSENCGQ